MPAELDGGALKGGAPRAVWFTSESDPGTVSARSVAQELRSRHEPAHLVWNPVGGDIVQMVAITRAAGLLPPSVGTEGRVCAQIMVVGRSHEPFTDGPMSGLDEIITWLDAWHVPRRWPSGPPLPPPQSYTCEGDRRDWARGGHFGSSQVPGTSRPDPGRIDIWRLTGADAALSAVPRPRMAAGIESLPAGCAAPAGSAASTASIASGASTASGASVAPTTGAVRARAAHGAMATPATVAAHATRAGGLLNGSGASTGNRASTGNGRAPTGNGGTRPSPGPLKPGQAAEPAAPSPATPAMPAAMPTTAAAEPAPDAGRDGEPLRKAPVPAQASMRS